MAVSAAKTFVSGEILTASDLNTLNTTILNGGEDLGWPATKAKDLDGQELILSSDANDSITASTNGQVDVRIGGSDVLVITATTMEFNGQPIVTGARFTKTDAAGFAVSRVNQLHANSGSLYPQNLFGVFYS